MEQGCVGQERTPSLGPLPSVGPVGLRVLVVHHHPDLYGSDLMLLRTLLGLREAGVHASLVVPDRGPLLDRAESAGISFEIIRYPQLMKSMLKLRAMAVLGMRLPADLLRITRAVRRHRPNVIYVNTLTLPYWALVGRLLGTPVICHVRELESGISRLTSRLLTAQLLAVQTVVANSEATAAYLVDNWPVLRDRIHVIYNGLDLPSGRAPDEWIPNQSIAVVGRLSPRKGQDLAIRSVRMLKDQGLSAVLHLVGTVFPGYEWYELLLRDLVVELGLEDRVLFHGYLSEPWSELQPDVVLVPSRLEPFGNVAVEAMAAGSAVVVTAVGGLVEIVEDGETGLVVPSEDPQALADAASRFLTNRNLRRDLVTNAQKTVRSRFSKQRYLDEILSVLQTAVAAGDVDVRSLRA